MPATGEEEFRQLQAEMERQAHPPSEQADDIDRNRQFTAKLEVTLAGRSWPLQPSVGLVALFQYVSRGAEEHENETRRAMAHLGAMYALLEVAIGPKHWDEFERHATRSKVSPEDVEPCIRQLVEAYTARPWRAGLRLLGLAAHSMAELDGHVLMGTGRGIATFTAREVCNLMLARIMDAQPGENERELMLEDLYLDYNPDDIALRQVAEMMADKKRRAEEEAAHAGSANDGDGEGGVSEDSAEARRQRFIARLAQSGEDRGVELSAGRPADSERG